MKRYMKQGLTVAVWGVLSALVLLWVAGPVQAVGWGHTVIMYPPAGATFTVPLGQGRNCVYVTDCSEALDTGVPGDTSPPAVPVPPVAGVTPVSPDVPAVPVPPVAVSEVPTPRGTPGWSFGVLIDRAGWTATADSEESKGGKAFKTVNVLDGDVSSYWHSPWSGAVDPPHPHELVIDMGSEHWVDGLVYTPRIYNPEKVWTDNGNLRDYEVWVSNSSLNDLGTRPWGRVASGMLEYGEEGQEQQIEFLIPNLTRYVKLVFLSDVNDSPYASAAEINITESLRDLVIEGGAVQ